VLSSLNYKDNVYTLPKILYISPDYTTPHARIPQA